MDKEHWKRELFSLYSRKELENDRELLNYLQSSLQPPRDGVLYATKESFNENILSEQTRDNTYGNSKYCCPFISKILLSFLLL